MTGGPTGGRGPPTVLEFLVINFSFCLMLLSIGSFSLVVFHILLLPVSYTHLTLPTKRIV